MEAVGVEAVVEGLSGFLGDMKKMDSAISGLIPGTKLLQNAFGFLGDTIDGVVNFTLNALAHALGELVADAVEFVINKLGELVQSTIEAGSEFQLLTLRLQTLNFNTLTESGKSFNEATTESIRLTKEQLSWITKLSLQTPYDAKDIANVFTLARSYGFASDESQTLTESISNFASGMALGSTEIERIIVNFGQMVQQGKVTQREMNDLARGSFVPVNDVLQIMSKNTGVAMDAMDDFRKTAESVPAFMEAFIELVGQRFPDSAKKMARTFSGATANLKETITTLGAQNIVQPILDVFGGRLANFIDELTKRWDELVPAAQAVGSEIATVVNTLLGFMPSAGGVADGVVKALNGVADWFKKHRADITDWIIQSSRWINNVLIPDIKRVVKWLFGTEEQKGAIQKFGDWIQESFIPAIGKAADWVENVLVPFLKNDLQPVFMALLPLAEALGNVLLKAFGGEPNQSFTDWIHNSLIPGIQSFTDWINTNQDLIATWVNRLVIAAVEVAIFVGAIGLAISVVSTIAAAFIDWLATINPVVTGIALLIGFLVLVSPVVALIVAGIVGLIAVFIMVKAAFLAFIDSFKEGLAQFAQNCADTVLEVQQAFQNGDWVGVGKGIIMGVLRGIRDWAFLLIDATMDAASAAINAVTSLFGVEVGNSLNLLGSASSPSTVNSNTTNTNNYNLAINSSAQTEPIVQDFNMLQSLNFHGR